MGPFAGDNHNYSHVLTTANLPWMQHMDVLRSKISQNEGNVISLWTQVCTPATLTRAVNNIRCLGAKGWQQLPGTKFATSQAE